MDARMDLKSLTLRADDFDRKVAATPDIDRFCSSTAWVIPAARAFHADHDPWVFGVDGGYVALAVGRSPAVGRYLAPLECMWGLACPFVGADQAAIAEAACESFAHGEAEWDTLWLSGIPRNSRLFGELVRLLAPRHRLGLGPRTKRHVADLEGGYEAYLSRRSAKFRANLRREVRAARREGIGFERLARPLEGSEAESLYERIIAIEQRSWKGITGQGIEDGAMYEFYRRMVPHLAARGALRVVFATRDGQDLAYVFGGVMGDTYRGLQASFAEPWRPFGLGNVVQAEMIRWLCEGPVRWYDMGTDLSYKTRWSEPGLTTVTLAVMS